MKNLEMIVPVVAIEYTQETLFEAFLELQEELSKLGLFSSLEVDSSGNLVVSYGVKQLIDSQENWRDCCNKCITESEGVFLFYWDIVECVDFKEYYERFPSEKKRKISKSKKAGK
jgi:hypothetical protein